MKTVRYHITHETHYRYSVPVALSQQLVHLLPRSCHWQHVGTQALGIEPAPTHQRDEHDIFGNPLTRLSFESPHDTLTITARLEMDVCTRTLPELDDSPAWETVCELLDYRAEISPAAEVLDACQFRYESPAVRLKKAFVHYSADCFTPGTPVLAAARQLMQKIFTEFTFDSSATEVTTPLMQVLEQKSGVCQDFAHLMIACLRSRGLAARYVSGYLLTSPPPGQPRMVGADASHAWVSVFCPQHGWVDFDPTNNLLPGNEHITLAWGRDFSDVSPLRGVILGGGSHELDVKVTV
ncbi:MAG TPA: transglutaminase family protein, partial [Pseudomonadales bacterium]|nr:transglutaminase family protein [Pseudomonadales bacterium]